MGTFALGEGVNVPILGLVVDEAYAPTWTLALPAGEIPYATLETHCEAVEVRLFGPDRWVGFSDPSLPSLVATLVHELLKATAES